MTIKSAIAEIEAHDTKRQRAQDASKEVCQILNSHLPPIIEQLDALSKAAQALQERATILCEGMLEDLNDEPLPALPNRESGNEPHIKLGEK